MFNSSGLLLLQRSCKEWEPFSFFQSFQYHYNQWPDIKAIVVLHGFIVSTATLLPLLLLPLVLSFSIFILPKLLWSLHDKSKVTSKNTRFVCVDEMHEEKGKDLYYYVIDDYGYGKRDLVADALNEGEDLLFLSSVQADNVADTFLEGQATDTGYLREAANNVTDSTGTCALLHEEDLMIDITIQDVSITSFHTPLTTISDDRHDGLRDDDKDNVVLNSKEEMALEGEIGLVGDESNEKVEQVKVEEEEEHMIDTCTNGSTSKSSCEWRGPRHYRDSETDGFFSSSSRRSSSQWESYTIYRKYDEDMMLFDRISSQKLKETESMRSIKVQPRSISERIVCKLSARNRKSANYGNPYVELEAAYVAQVCLAWEAINWNYNSFRRSITSERRKEDIGCPARIAQQFQQFLVLLQRFIENEPYEYGKRPEVYARIRISSPKLLQVPEFHGDDLKEGLCSRIPSSEFLQIMEDIIKTFMNFLRADKEGHWRSIKALIMKSKTNSVDPNMLSFFRKANRKKKAKLNDLQRGGNCMRKVELKGEEEMQILMCLVDMKIVSRVLRMTQINEQQLHWCEEKMRKVRFSNGVVQRDSTPLFFPGQ